MSPPLDFPSLRIDGAAAVSDRVQMGQLGDQQHGHSLTAQQSHLTCRLVSAQTPHFFTAVWADGSEFAPHLIPCSRLSQLPQSLHSYSLRAEEEPCCVPGRHSYFMGERCAESGDSLR